MTDTTSPFGQYDLRGLKKFLTGAAQRVPPRGLGRKIALVLRRVALAGGPAIVDATMDRIRLRLYMCDNVCERKYLFMPRAFDPGERELLRNSLKPGDTFVDVGANVGLYALHAAALVGDSGRVVAIEPNAAVVDRLKFNIRLNGFDGRIRVEQSCVSDREGMEELILDPTNLGGSSMVIPRAGNRLQVECHTLLAILQRHGISEVKAMKMDIEGAEDKVLTCFLRHAPDAILPRLLIIENSHQYWKNDLKASLAAAGYKMLASTNMNYVFSRA